MFDTILRKKFVPLSILFVAVAASAQPKQALTTGRIEYLDKQMEALLPQGNKLEVIASGFTWAEGPVWLKDSNCLMFSDTKQQTVFKWSAEKGLSKLIENAGYSGPLPYSDEPGTNGLSLLSPTKLLLCEHGNRRIALLDLQTKGGLRTIADNYQGKRFNSPNDVVARRNGDIYFTDPPYGLPKNNAAAVKQLTVNGVYRIHADSVQLLISDLDSPNGIAFSPDEKVMYVAVSSGTSPRIMAYPVLTDGSVSAGKIFFNATSLNKMHPRQGTDGLKVDAAGNLWSSGPGGVLVVNKEGKLLGRILFAGAVANCAWGDEGSVLYITGGSFLYRIKTATKGAGF